MYHPRSPSFILSFVLSFVRSFFLSFFLSSFVLSFNLSLILEQRYCVVPKKQPIQEEDIFEEGREKKETTEEQNENRIEERQEEELSSLLSQRAGMWVSLRVQGRRWVLPMWELLQENYVDIFFLGFSLFINSYFKSPWGDVKKAYPGKTFDLYLLSLFLLFYLYFYLFCFRYI